MRSKQAGSVTLEYVLLTVGSVAVFAALPSLIDGIRSVHANVLFYLTLPF